MAPRSFIHVQLYTSKYSYKLNNCFFLVFVASLFSVVVMLSCHIWWTWQLISDYFCFILHHENLKQLGYKFSILDIYFIAIQFVSKDVP